MTARVARALAPASLTTYFRGIGSPSHGHPSPSRLRSLRSPPFRTAPLGVLKTRCLPSSQPSPTATRAFPRNSSPYGTLCRNARSAAALERAGEFTTARCLRRDQLYVSNISRPSQARRTLVITGRAMVPDRPARLDAPETRSGARQARRVQAQIGYPLSLADFGLSSRGPGSETFPRQHWAPRQLLQARHRRR